MSLSFRIALYSALILTLGGGAAYLQSKPKPTVLGAVHHRHRKTVNPFPVENELCRAKKAIEKQAVALLGAGKYSELDGLAANFRNSQASFANGYWSLSFFYNAVSDLETDTPEERWQARVALLRRWFEEDVDCITPRIALARALIGYGWHARGTGWAADVSKDAWQTVYERVTEANRILEAARLLPEKCPSLYSTWMLAAMLTGASHEEYDETFTEGLKAFPSYTPFYFMKTWYLQERWHGERGEWQRFAKESADELGGEKGDVLYAQIVWYVHDLRVYGNPIAESGVQWPRVQRGFEGVRRLHPDSFLALSEYCAISGFAPKGARELMRRLFAEVGNRVDLAVWRKMDVFLRDRSWAYSNISPAVAGK